MRARRKNWRGNRDLNAATLVAICDGLSMANAGAPHELQVQALHDGLAEYGYTPVDVFRARFWLHRGKPATYQWDDPHV